MTKAKAHRVSKPDGKVAQRWKNLVSIEMFPAHADDHTRIERLRLEGSTEIQGLSRQHRVDVRINVKGVPLPSPCFAHHFEQFRRAVPASRSPALSKRLILAGKSRVS